MLKSILTVAISFLAFNSPYDDQAGYKPGDNASDFRLKSVDGKMVSMADFPQAKGFIIIFTTNTCPYCKLYEERIIELNNKFSPLGYPLIAINPNNPLKSPGDSFEKMKQRSQEKKFPFPYLSDENQRTAAEFGVTRTPHAVVVHKMAGKYKVVYAGAIDNNFKDKALAQEKYVENAVNLLLAGKEVEIKTTKTVGCNIYK